MTLTMALPPTIEAQLRERAAAAGKDPAAFAFEALQQKLAHPPDNGAAASAELTPHERTAEWLAWTASHQPLGYVVDDSRESFSDGGVA